MTESHHLREVLDDFRGAHVLCVGDVMLDRFVYGSVERVSAEAPIPILRVGVRRSMLGGVGNVARNVAALGAHAELIAVIGDDAASTEITDLAAAEPRLTARFLTEVGRVTTVKTRYMAKGQQLLRTDDETVTPISGASADQILETIRSSLRAADVMVLSDYLKGVLTDEILSTAIKEAQNAGVPVIADPKREVFAAYAGVTLLKPNDVELAAAMGRPCRTTAEVEGCAREAIRDLDIDAMLVTRAERGMSLISDDQAPIHLPARAIEVFDVSGAGDTVLATTAVALGAGADIATAATLASISGGIVVGKVGTAIVELDELAANLLAQDTSSTDAKIMSVDAAVETIDRWRTRGLKVGFTNGCFDLLHPGHISLLTEAKAACDRLIVAINSDDSVKRLKGPDRPAQHEAARSIVLASLGMVDMVVVFGEDTPVPLLTKLKPDMLIKGGDYTLNEVAGADVVTGYGGEVRLATLVPGHSSSGVIDRLAKESPKPARPSTRHSD